MALTIDSGQLVRLPWKHRHRVYYDVCDVNPDEKEELGKKRDFTLRIECKETGVNRVRFDGQTAKQKILHRKKNDPTSSSSVTTVLAPRLVGIELNPGPPSFSSPFSSSQLFADGLATIFSYLTLHEFIATASVSKYWFLIAASERTRNMIPLGQRFDFQHKPNNNIASAISENTFTGAMHWSLAHQVTRLVLSNMNHVAMIPHLLTRYTRLYDLSLDFWSHETREVQEEKNSQITIVLPLYVRSHLRKLGFDRAGQLEFPEIIQKMINEVGECQHLTSLALTSFRLSDIDREYDFTPLSRLTQLESFYLGTSFVYGSSHLFSLYASIGQLPHLTSIEHFALVRDYATQTNDIRQFIHLPALRRISLYSAILDWELLTELHRRVPSLTEIEVVWSKPVNLLALSQFDSLLTLTLPEEPTSGQDNHIASDAQISAIMRSRFRSVETLSIGDSCPISWNVLFGGDPCILPLVTAIQLWQLNHDPISSLCACAPTSTPLLARCQDLYLRACPTSSSLLDQLSQFTSLTTIFVETAHPDISSLSIYQRFDSPDYLPQLVRIEWRTQASYDEGEKSEFGPGFSITIDYDHRRGMNEVKFKGQTVEQKILHRTKFCDIHVTPSLPRLVGIELNRGPLAAVTPATLFTDGLAKIFSHLSLIDFIMSGRVSHHWFVIAASERTRKMRSQGGGVGGGGVVVVLPLSHKIEIKTQSLGCTSTISGGGGEGGGGGPGGGDGGEESNTESNGFTSTLLLLPPSSKWRLSHQVSDLSLTRISDWHQIPDQLQFYPHLTKLNLSLEWQRHVSTDSRPTEQLKIHSLLLPHWTLTALSIHRGVNHLRQGVQFIFDGIGECTQLTSLTIISLPLESIHDGDSPCDPTPLSRLTKLRSLYINSLPSDRLQMKSLFTAIGRLPSLTTLRHTQDGAQVSLDPDDIAPLELPQLTHIHLLNAFPDYEMFMTLHARMPQLVEIEYEGGMQVNLFGLSLFRQLESLTLMNPVKSGQDNHAASSSELAELFKTFLNLKWLHLGSHFPLDWSIIFDGNAQVLPRLEQLMLTFLKHDQLTPLFDLRPVSQPLISRLTHLAIRRCLVSNSHLLDQLGEFTSLTYLNVHISIEISPLTIYQRFDSIEYLPQLTDFVWVNQNEFKIDIKFAISEGVNFVHFEGQTVDQQILHRHA